MRPTPGGPAAHPKEALLRRSPPDPERLARLRLAATALLGFGLFTIFVALAFSFNSSGSSLNSGVFGAFLALLALAILRAPLGSAPLTFLSGLIGAWLVASPFVLGFFPFVLTTALVLWSGLLALMLSAFIYGEANRLNQPLDATD